MFFFFSCVLLTSFIFVFFSWKNISLSPFSVIILAALIRVGAIILFPGSYSSDIYSFLTTGHVLLSHVPAYPAMYFPFIFYVGATALLLGKYIAPFLFLKIIFVLFDVGVTYLVYKLSNNIQAAILYAVNPVMLIILAFHGQMDSLPLFFLLASILMVRKRNEGLAAFLLGVAIATKPWPLLFLAVFVRQSKRPWVYSLALLIPALSVFIHAYLTHVPLIDILTPIKNYRGSYGVWGLGNIMYTLAPRFWDDQIQLFRRVFMISFGAWSLIDHGKDILREVFLTMLAFFVFTPLFGVQWVAWIIPFFIMVEGPKSVGRVLLITIFVSLAFVGDISVIPTWYGPLRDAIVYSSGLVSWLSLSLLFLSYHGEFFIAHPPKIMRIFSEVYLRRIFTRRESV